MQFKVRVDRRLRTSGSEEPCMDQDRTERRAKWSTAVQRNALLSEARSRPRRGAGQPKVTQPGTRIGLSKRVRAATTFVT